MNQTGRVIAVDNESVWVDVSRQSACQSCQARNGCGKRMLDKAGFSSSHTLKLPRGAAELSTGDELELLLPDEDISRASLILYIVPLLLMLLFGALANAVWQVEGLTIVATFTGLGFGVLSMRLIDAWQGCRLSSHLIIKQ